MKNKRPLAINNSLVHGICNYNCITCHINKSNYSGPQDFQKIDMVKLLINRIKEAANDNIYIRYLALSGDGEPALHPRFEEVIELFGQMLVNWDNKKIKAPKIAMVTNGYHLDKIKINSVIKNKIGIKISFPSSDKSHYEQITKPVNFTGKEYQQVIDNINQLLEAAVKTGYDDIEFHVTPPVIELIRQDFNKTINTLSTLYAKNNLKALKLVMFPAISNRSGHVGGIAANIDFYHDLFRKYDRKKINQVRIKMSRSTEKFYSGIMEIIDVYRRFYYPCLWNANFMIAANGSSVCVNDQSLRYPAGNIRDNSIAQLLEMKKNSGSVIICKGCNQSPEKQTNILLKILGMLFSKKNRI